MSRPGTARLDLCLQAGESIGLLIPTHEGRRSDRRGGSAYREFCQNENVCELTIIIRARMRSSSSSEITCSTLVSILSRTERTLFAVEDVSGCQADAAGLSGKFAIGAGGV